jgi:PAS domain S-box-containing protein
MDRSTQELSQVIRVDKEKCLNCHACIAACPVKICNDGSGAHVNLNADTCIACGRCLTACTHGARYLADDFSRFMADAALRQPMIAFVAPSAVASFADRYLHFNGWLKSLGITAIFDVTLGAELCAMSYADHIRRAAPKLLIAQPCAAIVTYIQVHRPELLPYLAPLDSPMVHAMKMVRRFFPQFRDHKIVAISPCPAKKREFVETGWGDYNVTFASIRSYLQSHGIALEDFAAEGFAAPSPDTAAQFPVPGGLVRTVQQWLPDASYRARTIQGQDTVYKYLATLPEAAIARRDATPLVIDCLNCENGCNCGPASLNSDLGIDALEQWIQRRHDELADRNRRQAESNGVDLKQMLRRYWEAGNYTRQYRDLSANNTARSPNHEQRAALLRSMHKYSEQDHFNCCSCGYGSCDEMAAAIHNGMNRPENCHHYLARETQIGHDQLSLYRDHLERLVEARTEELEDSRQKLKDIVQGCPIAKFVIDVHHRVVHWNQALEKLSGIKAEQVIGTSEHWRIVYPEARHCLADFLVDGDEEAIARSYQTKCRKSTILDDAYEAVDFFPRLGAHGMCLHFTAALIKDSKGAIVGAVQTVEDITDQWQIETKLEESRRAAEAANRSKSEFLANMSHEIRTPMTAILGYADLLLSQDGIGSAPEDCRDAIATIKRNGEHLLGLINCILDLSKVESGKLEIHPVRCSPFALLSEVASLMRVRAAEKSIALEVEAIGLLPETVLTDPLRLRQILVNLVGNAIKFTDHGNVRLGVRLLGQGGLQRLQFDVTDTGIGMNEEQITRLFRPFSQVDSSAARKFGGTGLGLAISKRLVEALGGTIDVHSTPGKGSTFRVIIDPGPMNGIALVRQTEPTPGMASVPTAAIAGDTTVLHARVLLAEDGPDNQRLICFLLRKAGAEVTTVENGQLATESALAQSAAGLPFDVILMDMQMPVMDGYEATRTLRSRGYAGPIIALTAHAMVEDRQKCLDAGCDDYAIKPIVRQELLATVAHWADRGQTGGSSAIPMIGQGDAATPVPASCRG